MPFSFTAVIAKREPSIGATLAKFAAGACGWIQSHLEHRKTIDHLSGMSDHQLKDIGIERGVLEHAVRYGRQYNRTP